MCGPRPLQLSANRRLFETAGSAPQKPKPTGPVAASPKVPAGKPLATVAEGFRSPDGEIVEASKFGWSEM